MAKQLVQKEATSRREYIFIQSSVVSTGAGLTGLVFNTAGLVAWYVRPGAAAVQITPLVTQTETGAYTTRGFVAVANMPGVYRFDIPNAVFASGVDKAFVMLYGATNMAPVLLEYQLVDFDPEGDISSVRLQTDRMTFNASNEIASVIDGQAFAQTAADKVWSSPNRTLSSLGVLASEVWNVTCETAGTWNAKQIMSTLLAVTAGRTQNGRQRFLTPDGTATRADVSVTGNERATVTLTPSG